MANKIKLPTTKEGFLWGGAISAVQADGIGHPARTKVLKDYVFEKYPEKHWGGIGPAVTIDFTRRYKEDIALYKEMGVNSVRYGFMWSRLFPDGKTLSKDAVKHYHNVIDEFQNNGIEIMMQLFHFDEPLWMKSKGWRSEEIQNKFAEYAEFCFKEFGGKVNRFLTFNEPSVMHAHLSNPKYDWWGEGVKPTHEQMQKEDFGILLANAKAFYKFDELKKNGGIPKTTKLGVILNASKPYPKGYPNSTPEDIEAARLRFMMHELVWADSMIIGQYPMEIKEKYEEQGFKFVTSQKDIDFIKGVRMDFFGINYYGPARAKAPETLEKNPTSPSRNLYDWDGIKNPRMNIFRGWEIYPKGLSFTIEDLYKRYNMEVYISENGMGVDNENRFRDKDGIINDEYRVSFIKEHLMEIEKLLKKGIKVFGYHTWSISDVWSSENAFKNRYGFIEVNLDNNLERSMKRSGLWFKEFLKTGEFMDDFIPAEVIAKDAADESIKYMERAKSNKKNIQF